MAKSIQKEETLKGRIYTDYFSRFGYEQHIDNIDFVITDTSTTGNHYLWAEAQKGIHDICTLFTQLILTCKKTYEKGEYLAPPWLGCFDETQIAFVSFHDMLPIFSETDFNWNTAPRNHESADFHKAREKIKKLISATMKVYSFDSDSRALHAFITTHFTSGTPSLKRPLTKDNVVQIFIKWLQEVKPFINISKSEWKELKENGILECDFYRADIMSGGGSNITETLKIVFNNDRYTFQETIKGRLFMADIDFKDNGRAYRQFWNRYELLPAQEYQYRRDLLVLHGIRAVKGSFFTPKLWADRSKEYIAKVLGDKWQEEYYVWDCAAGTGNLLAGLTNKYNVWASDIDAGNRDTIKSLIGIDEKTLNVLPSHVFQFDFLNDSFDKLPDALKQIIKDPEKRKKLIIYINPPYAEVSSVGSKDKAGVNQSAIHDKYVSALGTAGRELFTQFLIRIYFEIPGCKIGEFSKIKILNGSACAVFRNHFRAKLETMFLCPAHSFDNVKGNFPIGFKVWDTDKKELFKKIRADVFDTENKLIAAKTVCSYKKNQFINKWITSNSGADIEYIGFLAGTNGNDVQQNHIVYILNRRNQMANPRGIEITVKNLAEVFLYFAIRRCFERTWLNMNDQFLYPDDGYKTDSEFQNNCTIFTLFHGQNRISSHYGVNHWIPFTEKDVDSKESFESHCMSAYLKRKTFSAEAQAVLNAGKNLWTYYHTKIRDNKDASVNASFYDIREFFQERTDKGILKATSDDESYNALIADIRRKQRTLSETIQPKVYEYGFLKDLKDD
ncbi:MAG: hypothetical protein LBQ77_01515 [Treponema sp.]|jgi:hypothetical protein|nr:hypothetical protein [Treponema sp.]